MEELVDGTEVFAGVVNGDGIIAGAVRGDRVVAKGGLVSVAAVVFVGDVFGGGGVGVVGEEELAEADGWVADFGEFGEDGGGVVKVVAEGVGVEVVDIVVVSEFFDGVFSVAFGIKTEINDEN